MGEYDRIAEAMAREHPGASAVGDIPRFAPLRDASNPTSAARVADYGSVPGARSPVNTNRTPSEEIARAYALADESKARTAALADETKRMQDDIRSPEIKTDQRTLNMLRELDAMWRQPKYDETVRPFPLGGKGGPKGLMADTAKGSAPGTVINSLDMSEAARKARATEQGFGEQTYYKGHYPYSSGGPIVKSNGEVIDGGPYVLKDQLSGFFSHDPAVASRFAGVGLFDHNAVAPVRLRYSNPLEIDAQGKHAAAVQFDQIAKRDGMMDELDRFRTAFDKGHDAVIIRNTKDEGDIIRIKDPQQVRSTQAAFDPAKRDSANLLAASPSASAPGLAANSTQQQTPPIDAELKRRLLDALMMGSPDA